MEPDEQEPGSVDRRAGSLARTGELVAIALQTLVWEAMFAVEKPWWAWGGFSQCGCRGTSGRFLCEGPRTLRKWSGVGKWSGLVWWAVGA